MKKAIVISTLVLALSVGVFTPGVLAVEQQGATDNGNSATAGSDNAKKLQGDALKACKGKETAINAIMSRVADRAEKRLKLFDQIKERLQKYYEDNKLSSSEYAEKMALVEQKRTEAQVQVQAELKISTQFKCDGDDPKGTMTSFKNQQKTEIGALNDYKQALKDVVEVLKTVSEEE